MPIYNGPGGVDMAAIYHGSTPISRVYNGSTLVWQKGGGGGGGGIGGNRVYYKSAGTQALGTGSITPALPTGWQENDIFVLVMQSMNEAVTTPSGWTPFASSPQGTGPAATPGSCRLSLYWKRATSSETAPLIADSGSRNQARIFAYSACALSGSPIDAESGDVQASASSSVTWPSVTTTSQGCMVVNALSHAITSSGVRLDTSANADLTNFEEIYDSGAATGGGGGLAVVQGYKDTAGTTGSTTGTLVTSATQGRITFSLKPEAYGAPYIAGYSVGIPGSSIPVAQGYAANDILVLLIETANQPISAPSGWTEVANSPQGTGTAGAIGATALSVFWKRASSSESSVSYLGMGGDHIAAVMVAVRGCATTGTPYEASNGNSLGTASTNFTFPAVTTLGANRLILMAGSVDTDSSVDQFVSDFTNSNLAFTTKVAGQGVNPGNGGSVACAVGVKVAAGSTGTTTSTVNTSAVQARICLAFPPA